MCFLCYGSLMAALDDPEVVKLCEELAAAELRAKLRAQSEANEAAIKKFELQIRNHKIRPRTHLTPES